MSDHENYCKTDEDGGDFNDNPEIIEEKTGDEHLIELYRERSYLYDNKDLNFKNTIMKENAWHEISNIMIELNYGDFYTPQYCHKRCISLREQYNREKKRMESGRAALNLKSRQFSFYSQLTFLDQIIKRRRTYNNLRSRASASSVEKNKIGTETYDSDNISVCSSSNKENTRTNYEQNINIENSQDVLEPSPKLKKRKINETKELEPTFPDISNRIMNCTDTPKRTSDDAFIEFIKIQLESVPEHEKHIRRKMIMDAVSTPLTSNPEHCNCNELLKQLLQLLQMFRTYLME